MELGYARKYCICISKVTKFKANNNGMSRQSMVNVTVFA